MTRDNRACDTLSVPKHSSQSTKLFWLQRGSGDFAFPRPLNWSPAACNSLLQLLDDLQEARQENSELGLGAAISANGLVASGRLSQPLKESLPQKPPVSHESIWTEKGTLLKGVIYLLMKGV